MAILGLTTLIILFYPRQYHSTSKLLLRIGRENVTLDPTASTAGDTQLVMRTREGEVITALEMMSSREILHQVVNEIGADAIISGSPPGGEPKPPGPLSVVLGPVKESLARIDPIESEEKAVVKLEGDLDISAPSEGGVVTVEYTTDTPELAQMILAKWVELFQEHYITATRTRGAYEFFVEQEELITKEMEGLRAQLKDAKNHYGLVTIDGQQKLIEEQMQAIKLDKLANDSKLSEVRTRIKALEQVAAGVAPTRITQNVTGLPNEARDRMRSRLYDLEVEEKEASAYLTASHPKLAALREQIETAAEVLVEQKADRRETTEAINPTRLVIDERLALESAELAAHGSKAAALDAQEKNLLKSLAQLNEHEQVVADLDRRLEIMEERYRVHSQRFEQARLDRELEEERISSVNVVQKATLEYRPVTPQKKLCAVFGLVAGLAAAFGIPMWIEAGKSADLARVRVGQLTGREDDVEFGRNGAQGSARETRQAIPR